MRYLTRDEVVRLHERVVQQSGGSAGIRDEGGLDSAISQPQMTFSGQDLYPTLDLKAAALGFSLVLNHPFVDGNKRIGHFALEAFLMLNSHELAAEVDEAEQVILELAAGQLPREKFAAWVTARIRPLPPLV